MNDSPINSFRTKYEGKFICEVKFNNKALLESFEKIHIASNFSELHFSNFSYFGNFCTKNVEFLHFVEFSTKRSCCQVNLNFTFIFYMEILEVWAQFSVKSWKSKLFPLVIVDVTSKTFYFTHSLVPFNLNVIRTLPVWYTIRHWIFNLIWHFPNKKIRYISHIFFKST